MHILILKYGSWLTKYRFLPVKRHMLAHIHSWWKLIPVRKHPNFGLCFINHVIVSMELYIVTAYCMAAITLLRSASPPTHNHTLLRLLLGFHWKLTCCMSVKGNLLWQIIEWQNILALLAEIAIKGQKKREGRNWYKMNPFWTYLWNEEHFWTQK